jgi:hypothetical protein
MGIGIISEGRESSLEEFDQIDKSKLDSKQQDETVEMIN